MKSISAKDATQESVNAAVEAAFKKVEAKYDLQGHEPVEKEEWKALADEGMTARQAAEILGKSVGAAHGMQRRHEDIKFRKSRRGPPPKRRKPG